MSIDDARNFIAWLDAIEREKWWTDNQYATQAGISHSALSRARTGIPPKWEVCVALADAAGIPREEAFRAAGLMKTDPKLSWIKERLIDLIKGVDDDTAEQIKAMTDVIVKQKAAKSSTPERRK